jgi:hypothetical protein
MAGQAVEEILNGSTNVDTAADAAALIMAKGSKAATDIARNVALIPGINADSIDFARELANANKKFVLNAAVGVSMADDGNSAGITLAAITHDPADKAALAGAAKTAGAVTLAVDVEQGTLIAHALGGATSATGTGAGKPLKLSQIPAIAAALAKSIQTKIGVKTVNRMDELGELGAILTHHVINLFTNDTKGQAARSKMIATIGSNIIKSLSKKELNDQRTQAADLTEAEDVAGSIAQAIFDFAGLDQATKDALLADGGTLVKALMKSAGKTYASAVDAAFDLVRAGNAGVRYETGTPGLVTDGSIKTDIKDQLNDPETDNRDA